MLPFEFVATATASPRYSPGGSLRKFATVVNGISGTPVTVAFACANAGPAASVRTAHAEARIRVIERPLSRAEPIPAPPVVQRAMRDERIAATDFSELLSPYPARGAPRHRRRRERTSLRTRSERGQ